MKKNKHGGDIYRFAKHLGIKTSEVIDFSSNINQYKPKIQGDLNTINVTPYANPHYPKLKKALAKHYGIKTTQMTLFNGASSAIATILKDIKNVVIYAPAYGEYRRFAPHAMLINRFEALHQDPPYGALVIFVNPATPDGKYYPLKKLLEIWKKQNCVVLIDESFLEFTTYPSAITFLQSYKKLFILKSLTKFYACAGVRVAIMIHHSAYTPSNLPLWNISTFDMHYILWALQDKDFVTRTHKKIAADKKYLLKLLQKSPLIEKIYPSDANFILVKLKNINAKELQNMCDKEAIMIRNCDNFDFLDKWHVRFAVRPKKDIKKLKRVLYA